jgi:hypothetical protein
VTTSSPSESAITGEIRELSRGRKRRPISEREEEASNQREGGRGVQSARGRKRRPISEREEEASNQHKTPVGVSSSRPRRLVLDSSDLKVYDLMSTDS